MKTLARLLVVAVTLLCATRADAAAPTLISYTETASWITAGASKSTASISWQTNDVIVALGVQEANNTTLGLASCTGLTFVNQKTSTGVSGNTSYARLDAVVAPSSSSSTCSMSGSATFHWGFAVWVFRNSNGIGNSAEQHTATKTVALTASAADGYIVWCSSDFNADVVTTTAGTPTPTTTRQKFQDSTRYSLGIFELADQVSAGSVSYGQTGGGTVGPFSIIVFEVKAGAGGGGVAGCKNGLLMLGAGCEE